MRENDLGSRGETSRHASYETPDIAATQELACSVDLSAAEFAPTLRDRMQEGVVIAGVDGCKAGWVAVLDEGQRGRRVEVFPRFIDLLRSPATTIVIDVPIGIMSIEPRFADGAARELLRHRSCCVFSAPYRPMLAARSHLEACEIRERLDGKRCSRQAFAIFAKIAEVDAFMTPELQERVVEGHPEVTFAVMEGGCPMDHAKKSTAGRTARLTALRRHFQEIDMRVAERRPSGVGRDDLLDAYAMLWTARRHSAGTAISFPSDVATPQRDERGLRARMLG